MIVGNLNVVKFAWQASLVDQQYSVVLPSDGVDGTRCHGRKLDKCTFFGQDKVKNCLFNPSVYSSFSMICEIFWLEFEGKGDR